MLQTFLKTLKTLIALLKQGAILWLLEIEDKGKFFTISTLAFSAGVVGLNKTEGESPKE